MEDTLRDGAKLVKGINIKVLILVLMEDTLRENTQRITTLIFFRLNPCSNGRYSQS